MPSETMISDGILTSKRTGLIKSAFPASLTRTGLNEVTALTIMASSHSQKLPYKLP
ncbi:hypothetical protein [Neisseria lactamica]|uniref:Uncharacterized protein n=1 Tax=Neisseria lactamica ATCC 23970 TaxID=546265 RepID=D0W767_NEILA|nr:hypothetical protein [Neisseria lactamica]EEZ76670.1 hypothetical protein NEILACOT_03365 [Neisseria lactamica ATCC 23970]